MRIFLTFLIVFFCNHLFSQESKTKLLLGKKETYVRNYLDSLTNANKSAGVYFEEDKNEYGELSMGVYSEEDESVLGYLVIYCFFQKIGDEQVCVRQLIGGSPEYGEKQKPSPSSEFKQLSKNKWTKPFDMGFTILAEYVLEEENDTYYITFNLVY